MIVMKYSVKTGKNHDDFQIILFEILKKNEWRKTKSQRYESQKQFL